MYNTIIKNPQYYIIIYHKSRYDGINCQTIYYNNNALSYYVGSIPLRTQ